MAKEKDEAPAPAAQPAPPKMKKKEKWNDKKIVAQRASRQGDAGYQLSCAEAQVTIILEDGSEQVVKESDLLEPEKSTK